MVKLQYLNMILMLPCVVCAGIILKDFSGKGSYLPGERTLLVCDYSNVSDPENVVFFCNGIEVQNDPDYHIFPCITPSSCQTTTLLILEFVNRLSGNYTCNVTSGSQVIASNILPVPIACKLFSVLPSLPLNFELIFYYLMHAHYALSYLPMQTTRLKLPKILSLALGWIFNFLAYLTVSVLM